MFQLILMLILNLFSITNPNDSLITVPDKRIVYQSYYTPDEQLLLENKIADRLLDPIWKQHRLERKNPLFIEYYCYFDSIRKDELDKINYFDLDKGKHSLATKFIFEYRIKAQIEIPFVSFYDDDYIYHDRTTCLERHCFSPKINNYTITPIVSYDHKGKLKKQDFLDRSFLNKLEYPKYKMDPWYTFFILRDRKDNTIKTGSLDYISEVNNDIFYNYYQQLLNIKDSLHIVTLFTIDKLSSGTIFGLSNNGEIYVLKYSSKEKKHTVTRIEDYVNENPKIFKGR